MSNRIEERWGLKMLQKKFAQLFTPLCSRFYEFAPVCHHFGKICHQKFVIFSYNPRNEYSHQSDLRDIVY